jgi:opacity protein-like surface antigen
MGNAAVDIATQTKFTPYLFAGIGFAQVELNGLGQAGVAVTANGDDTVFAYQLGLGVGYAATESITLGLEYRYFATSDPEDTITGGDIEWEYPTHNILVGIRYSF